MKLGWLTLVIIAVAAILINGFIATLEDDLPGGFNNPHGTRTPRYAVGTVRVVKWGLAFLLCTFGIAFFVAGLNGGNRLDIPFVAGISAARVLLSVALLGRYRWAFWTAMLSAFGGIAVRALLR
ncbi:MAG TPA: hypothetical protein VK714_00660 [Myxococcota bacterium]|nr:hypothetical protein [Myxococcota bacterium]